MERYGVLLLFPAKTTHTRREKAWRRCIRRRIRQHPHEERNQAPLPQIIEQPGIFEAWLCWWSWRCHYRQEVRIPSVGLLLFSLLREIAGIQIRQKEHRQNCYFYCNATEAKQSYTTTTPIIHVSLLAGAFLCKVASTCWGDE